MDFQNHHSAAPAVKINRREKGNKMTNNLFLDDVIPDVTQIRKEFDPKYLEALMDSIKASGLVTPIIVSQPKNGKHTIIDGERRFCAYQKLHEAEPENENWKSIPVTIIASNDQLAGIIANLAKVEYNPIEYAEALDVIQKSTSRTHKELANLVGKSRSTITEYLDLLKLPQAIKALAKAESVVPFRQLKRLAAEEKSDEDKTVEYNRLHEQYKKKGDDREIISRKGNIWNPARKARAFQKKLDNFSVSLGNVKIQELKSTAENENLKNSLKKMINTAQNLLVSLEMDGNADKNGVGE